MIDEKRKIIFFDFDGVIKESLDVKTNAFVNLFASYGNDVSERVRVHHLNNGGMSRFVKIPIYLSWCGITVSDEVVNAYCNKFKELVFQGVVDAEWVPGVKEYIKKKYSKQILIIVSATPQQEIESILAELNFKQYFTAVFGAPKNKKDAISESMAKHQVMADECLMIGDARADMEAAAHNNVPFLVRIHNSNKELFSQYTGEQINDFCNL